MREVDMSDKRRYIKRDITYEELSELLQEYLDDGDALGAIGYCQMLAEENNAYGYLFQGFIYEEGSGEIACDLDKALWCYEKAQEAGLEVERDIWLLKKKQCNNSS